MFPKHWNNQSICKVQKCQFMSLLEPWSWGRCVTDGPGGSLPTSPWSRASQRVSINGSVGKPTTFEGEAAALEAEPKGAILQTCPEQSQE